jgi:hypothetical protein
VLACQGLILSPGSTLQQVESFKLSQRRSIRYGQSERNSQKLVFDIRDLLEHLVLAYEHICDD